MSSENITKQHFTISRATRNQKYKHRSLVVWFTGLSGSGKSTLANELEHKLFEDGIHTFVLDGDNTRMGINKDLDFSAVGRKENIRRVAEVAKLLNDSGVVVITSFISPFVEDRENARAIIGQENFIEVFVDCPLEICEQRDVKGLYKKARANMIPEFTGISSPFEKPVNPAITVYTATETIEKCIKKTLSLVKNKLAL